MGTHHHFARAPSSGRGTSQEPWYRATAQRVGGRSADLHEQRAARAAAQGPALPLGHALDRISIDPEKPARGAAGSPAEKALAGGEEANRSRPGAVDVPRLVSELPREALPHRDDMERSFGRSFAEVEAHTGPRATAACDRLGAAAFTHGGHVVFGGSPPSRSLVAHELTHVVQQEGGSTGGVSAAGDRFESQAERVGAAASRGERVSVGRDRGAPALQLFPEFEGASTRRVITDATQRVRDAPSSTATQIDTLHRGNIVETAPSAPGFVRITSATFNNAAGTPVTGYIGIPGTQPIGAQRQDYGAVVVNLVQSYTNVSVWSPDCEREGHFVTPYVLYVGDDAIAGLDAEWQAHRNLNTRTPGQQVEDVDNTHNAFFGKGTPNAVQVIAQAAIDAGLCTVDNVQAYVNDGPMNEGATRQNGRFGVDCSGFTAVAVALMGGLSAEDGPGLNLAATAYRPEGNAITQQGYTQVTVGQSVQHGDIASFMNSNHVVVLRTFVNNVQVPAAQAGGGSLAAARITLISESVGEATDATTAGVGRVTEQRNWMHVHTASATPGSRYSTTNVHQNGAATWTLFEPTGNETWQQLQNGGIQVNTTGTVRHLSIVRPPSHRPTTPQSEL
jgi:hypothetical protein